ncbi:hypothetical protein [Actinophytocola sp.]|uniref:hypothetical protein n=1 Tax=Actinophytocola sp. TaxID=1872138 RepID=UPI00389A770A
MVREIAAVATFTVGHDAYFGRTCGDGFVVVSEDGELTVLDAGLRLVRRLDLGGRVTDLSVVGGRWAWVVGERLWIGDPTEGGSSAPLAGESACRWLPSGRELWTAFNTGDEVLVELRTADGRVQRAVTVPDAFRDSMVRVRNHPHERATVLWLVAGPDGQQSWLVRDDGAALTAEHLPADDCLPAQFAPTGDWFLTAGDDRLTRLSWPDLIELGALKWADVDPRGAADGSDEAGGCLMALPGGFVSWSSANGRLFTVDPGTMALVDEIALPHGDFVYAVPSPGGNVLSVHDRRTLVLSALRDWSPDPNR